MYLPVFTILAFASVSYAHFRLLYPLPRGEFVADKEPSFCGGYDNALTNRSLFPLSGGFFTIKTGHGNWTSGVLISTVQNPNSFDNFSSRGQQQIIRPFAKDPHPGTFCAPLNLSGTNIAGVKDGANVTIQVVFDGGDGNLYQCADLTLSNNFTISESCQNQTNDTSSSPPPTGGSLGLAPNVDITGYVATAIVLGLCGVTFLQL